MGSRRLPRCSAHPTLTYVTPLLRSPESDRREDLPTPRARQRPLDPSELMEGRIRDGGAARLVFWRGERPALD